MTKVKSFRTCSKALFGTLLILLSGLLVACGDNTTTSSPLTTTPASTTVSSPSSTTVSVTTAPAVNSPSTLSTTIPDEAKQPYESALSDLAKRTNLPTSDIKLMGYSFEQFSDSSLGCPKSGQRYSQVITPGFRFQLQAAGQLYDYRATASGTRVLLCTTPDIFSGTPQPTKP
jgi:hypothetical protein